MQIVAGATGIVGPPAGAASTGGVMAKILVVDDEPSILSVLTTLLRKHHHEAVSVQSGTAALELIREQAFDVVISDIRMEPVDGLQVLREVRKTAPATAVILLTGYAAIKTAVEAMRGGAFDYVTKPFKVDELMVTVDRAVEYHKLLAENAGLKAQLTARYRLENIVAESPGMRRVCEMIERVAPTDATVLIIGESGTGKELVARAIHANSPRMSRPFIAINCAAMPEPLLESEMFGHVKGAFTGAVGAKEGLFAAAAGGTIFLDEIGAMPLGIQAKFLRVLQDKEIRKVGGTESIKTDVRVLAATNEPLERKIAKQQFREDLFYRISVIPIEIPPLRERPEDILPLLAAVLEKEKKDGKPIPTLDLRVQQMLETYAWPGNVRELENTIRHALTFAQGEKIVTQDLPTRILEAAGSLPPSRIPRAQIEESRGKSLKAFLRSKEKDYIASVIESMDGDKEKAAQALKVSLATLYRKLPME
jgi:DNA-binding NtrC family response regulator